MHNTVMSSRLLIAFYWIVVQHREAEGFNC